MRLFIASLALLLVGFASVATAQYQTVISPPSGGSPIVSGGWYSAGTVFVNGSAYPSGTIAQASYAAPVNSFPSFGNSYGGLSSLGYFSSPGYSTFGMGINYGTGGYGFNRGYAGYGLSAYPGYGNGYSGYRAYGNGYSGYRGYGNGYSGNRGYGNGGRRR